MEWAARYQKKNKKIIASEIHSLRLLRLKLKEIYKIQNDSFQLFYVASDNPEATALTNQQDFEDMKSKQKIKIRFADDEEEIVNLPKKSEQVYVKAESKQDVYFQCYFCKVKFRDGPRFRCDTCVDFDFCNECYKANSHPLDHKFVYIQNRKAWQQFDLWPILEAVLNPSFNFNTETPHEKITIGDIERLENNAIKYLTEKRNLHFQTYKTDADSWIEAYNTQQKNRQKKQHKQKRRQMKQIRAKEEEQKQKIEEFRMNLI